MAANIRTLDRSLLFPVRLNSTVDLPPSDHFLIGAMNVHSYLVSATIANYGPKTAVTTLKHFSLLLAAPKSFYESLRITSQWSSPLVSQGALNSFLAIWCSY